MAGSSKVEWWGDSLKVSVFLGGSVVRLGDTVAANMGKSAEAEHAYYHVLRVVIAPFMKGVPPTLAVEFGRRAIPGHVRPSFQECEKYIKGSATGADAEAPAAVEAPAA